MIKFYVGYRVIEDFRCPLAFMTKERLDSLLGVLEIDKTGPEVKGEVTIQQDNELWYELELIPGGIPKGQVHDIVFDHKKHFGVYSWERAGLTDQSDPDLGTVYISTYRNKNFEGEFNHQTKSFDITLRDTSMMPQRGAYFGTRVFLRTVTDMAILDVYLKLIHRDLEIQQSINGTVQSPTVS